MRLRLSPSRLLLPCLRIALSETKVLWDLCNITVPIVLTLNEMDQMA